METNAVALNKYATQRCRGRRFSVPAGTGGIIRDCPTAYITENPCRACGCIVRYADPYGSWCLNCGKY